MFSKNLLVLFLFTYKPKYISCAEDVKPPDISRYNFLSAWGMNSDEYYYYLFKNFILKDYAAFVAEETEYLNYISEFIQNDVIKSAINSEKRILNIEFAAFYASLKKLIFLFCENLCAKGVDQLNDRNIELVLQDLDQYLVSGMIKSIRNHLVKNRADKNMPANDIKVNIKHYFSFATENIEFFYELNARIMFLLIKNCASLYEICWFTFLYNYQFIGNEIPCLKNEYGFTYEEHKFNKYNDFYSLVDCQTVGSCKCFVCSHLLYIFNIVEYAKAAEGVYYLTFVINISSEISQRMERIFDAYYNQKKSLQEILKELYTTHYHEIERFHNDKIIQNYDFIVSINEKIIKKDLNVAFHIQNSSTYYISTIFDKIFKFENYFDNKTRLKEVEIFFHIFELLENFYNLHIVKLFDMVLNKETPICELFNEFKGVPYDSYKNVTINTLTESSEYKIGNNFYDNNRGNENSSCMQCTNNESENDTKEQDINDYLLIDKLGKRIKVFKEKDGLFVINFNSMNAEFLAHNTQEGATAYLNNLIDSLEKKNIIKKNISDTLQSNEPSCQSDAPCVTMNISKTHHSGENTYLSENLHVKSNNFLEFSCRNDEKNKKVFDHFRYCPKLKIFFSGNHSDNAKDSNKLQYQNNPDIQMEQEIKISFCCDCNSYSAMNNASDSCVYTSNSDNNQQDISKTSCDKLIGNIYNCITYSKENRGTHNKNQSANSFRSDATKDHVFSTNCASKPQVDTSSDTIDVAKNEEEYYTENLFKNINNSKFRIIEILEMFLKQTKEQNEAFIRAYFQNFSQKCINKIILFDISEFEDVFSTGNFDFLVNNQELLIKFGIFCILIASWRFYTFVLLYLLYIMKIELNLKC
ncbi:hypothetical protein EDEG_02208 [Edhazardia aedis USNM 41457]|uniref:Uncharacterized protein n=1 Tax=Edhazardia aedis (strain USNM 41457) TaxID=1003232 RepID=J8ZUT2_EDHAE|nr:hypothetical protein EDEG_02208 [Edhazardia aedis USNM 41457]|eukprot:EJW03443.1 hypothetical protein EDEG_02208 [Edhazardia aedis USNM 41457]